MPTIGKGEWGMAASRLTDEHAHETDGTPATADHRRLKRRGLIAAAATLAAGALAKRTAETVSAAYALQGDASNSAGALTAISGTVASNPILRLSNGFGGTPDARADGVQGYASGGNVGVYGRNDASGGIGVKGLASAGTAVFGYSANGQGVTGQSGNSIGVYAVSGGYGVYAAGGVYGVYGTCSANNANSVYGLASTGGSNGVLGTVAAGAIANGVLGDVATAGQCAVAGTTSTAGAYALYGTNGNTAGAYAGYFSGTVVVAGDFSVTGSKSALVPHPDGTHRLLYCVEAPEAWFEDFGEGQLINGAADIALDPDFVAVADTTQLHVFFTEAGDHHALYLAAKRADGFTVRADAALLAAKGKHPADANGAFSYRVVARRKDRPGGRLAKAAVPKQPTITVAEPPSGAAKPSTP